ncbi:MAG TPA: SLC13 family permease [Bacillota bacterium]|nr:SLC13 family permease [Bacillota bacterium]
MDIGLIAVFSLVLAVAVSFRLNRNIGLLAISLAFLVAALGRDPRIDPALLITFFPLRLFLTLVGVTLLFSMAELNGTLARLAQWFIRASGGSPALIPVLLFVFAAALAAAGPGNIAATVVLAPVAMSIAAHTKISAFLAAVMVVNGANAGALSPVAPTGIIAATLVGRLGLPPIPGPIFMSSLVGNGVAALLAYLLFGGLRLLAAGRDPRGRVRVRAALNRPLPPWERRQLATLAAVALLIVLVLGLRWDLGFTALTLAVVLSLLRAADEQEAVKRQPWYMILMLVGVMLLVEVAARTGGLDHAVRALAAIAQPATVTGIMGFVAGFVSTYSGSSAVVMPTFIPMIPGLVHELGVVGAAALELQKNLVYTITVSAHLVDASPLSLLGALCLAAAPATEDRTRLFRRLLIWGQLMALGGGAISFIFFR